MVIDAHDLSRHVGSVYSHLAFLRRLVIRRLSDLRDLMKGDPCLIVVEMQMVALQSMKLIIFFLG